jgi:FtsP/CotA-like multicopper oxidase with cupredoxin domain
VSTEIGNVVNPDFETCPVDEQSQTSVYMVNGLYEPYLNLKTGEYRVLQLIHAIGDVFSLELVLSDPDSCSMWTIAKDGVFFDKAVREHVVFMWSATRIDLLISCSKAGNYSLLSNGTDTANSWFYNVEDGSTRITQNIMFFHVEDTLSKVFEEKSFDMIEFPPKPFYLQNLVDLNESEMDQIIDIVGDYDLLSLNGDRFINATTYSHFLDLGKVYQLNLYADNYTHPMHLHINHFQIAKIEPTGALGQFNQKWQVEHSEFLWNVGEWRDTIPTVAGYKISVRFRADTWSGPMIYHCHYLPHADHGMMMILYIRHPDNGNSTVPAIPFNVNSEDNESNLEYQNLDLDDQDQIADKSSELDDMNLEDLPSNIFSSSINV